MAWADKGDLGGRGRRGNSLNVAPGVSELRHSGPFLEIRGERSVRNCAEMERGVNKAPERCRKKVEVSMRVHTCVHAWGGMVIMILPTVCVPGTSHTAPHLILTTPLGENMVYPYS